MKTHLAVLLSLLLAPALLPAQITFMRTYGGAQGDQGYSVQMTPDHGYVVCGATSSFGNGSVDVYLVRTDSLGDTLWTRTHGGTDMDFGYSVRPTADSGFILTGFTLSFGSGLEDVYLVRTDRHGDALWTTAWGGSYGDRGYDALETQDHGFVVVGFTAPPGSYLPDVLLLKTDAEGGTLWSRAYGGHGIDDAGSVLETSDHGFVVAGYTELFGNGDAWLLKTDSMGDTAWTRHFGGGQMDAANAVCEAPGGGYALAGATYSYGAGSSDVYVVRTDTDGDTLWTSVLGTALMDEAYSIKPTSDSGFIVAASRALGGSQCDGWLVKLDQHGEVQWDRALGGPMEDELRSVFQTRDQGFTAAGSTWSYGAGASDVFLVKTDEQGLLTVTQPVEPRLRAAQLGFACEPNPCDGRTTVRFRSQTPSAKLQTGVLRVTDAAGRVVLRQACGVGYQASSVALDLRVLSSGVYILRLDVAGQHATQRLVVQH